MSQKVILVVVVASAILWGCVAPAEFGTQEKLEESRAIYAQCIAEHGAGSAACETSLENYRSSKRSYEQNSSGVQPGESRPQEPVDSGWTR